MGFWILDFGFWIKKTKLYIEIFRRVGIAHHLGFRTKLLKRRKILGWVALKQNPTNPTNTLEMLG
jgi:hypothetical protein